jgi:RimJ/RimL family protein N-acetyltransferase
MAEAGTGDSTLVTDRLTLAALRVEDAEEMAGVLDDDRLHEFTGGRPAAPDELRARYARLVAGSGRPDETWRNWVVRRRTDGRAVGTVQATIVDRDGVRTALVAWVIGVPWQGRGFAGEAARALVGWARDQGVHEVVAHVHPDHHVSAAVAARAGLSATEEIVDGERVWRTSLRP